MAHTPGPWHVGQGCSDQVLTGGKRLLIVKDDIAEWEANARLVAVAPDGLALAKIVADMWHLNGENRRNQEIVARELAKSIIAKAEGR